MTSPGPRALPPHPVRPVTAPTTGLALALAALIALVALVAGCTGSGGGKRAGHASASDSSGLGAGPGGRAGSPPATAIYHACSLLNPQDAAAILGAPVGTGKDQKATGIPYPSCTYTASGGAPASGAPAGAPGPSGSPQAASTLALTVFAGNGTVDLLQTYLGRFPGLVGYSGVGDKAYRDSGGRMLLAFSGQTGCLLQRSGGPVGSDAAVRRLAEVCVKVFAVR